MDSKAKNESERIDSKMTNEEAVGEFLPATRIEDDTAPAESEGSKPALAALGENSGIIDGEVVAVVKSGGDGEVTGSDESRFAGADKGGDGSVQIEPVHAAAPEPYGFESLDIGEIENFIFIGRTKG